MEEVYVIAHQSQKPPCVRSTPALSRFRRFKRHNPIVSHRQGSKSFVTICNLRLNSRFSLPAIARATLSASCKTYTLLPVLTAHRALWRGLWVKALFIERNVLFSKPSRVYSSFPPKSRADVHRASQPVACHALRGHTEEFSASRSDRLVEQRYAHGLRSGLSAK